jgi:hypothetical protein
MINKILFHLEHFLCKGRTDQSFELNNTFEIDHSYAVKWFLGSPNSLRGFVLFLRKCMILQVAPYESLFKTPAGNFSVLAPGFLKLFPVCPGPAAQTSDQNMGDKPLGFNDDLFLSN